MAVIRKQITVICQHNCDGTTVPIKFKFEENGSEQVYQVKAYRILSRPGEYTMPNNVKSVSDRWMYECKINVLGSERIVKLFYYLSDNSWEVAF